MTKKLYEETDIQNIANSIRSKNGTTDTYKVSEMSNAIDNISSGGLNWTDYWDENLGQDNAGLYNIYYKLKKLPPKEILKLIYYSKTYKSYMIPYAHFTNIDDFSEAISLYTGDFELYQAFKELYYYPTNPKLTISDISNIDTSNVTNMSNCFYCCNYLKDLTGLEKWDTGNVKNMSNCFTGLGKNDMSTTYNLNPIKNWDTKNVTDFSYMFYQIYNNSNYSSNWKTYRQWNIELNWCLDKATNCSNMFGSYDATGSYVYDLIDGKFSGFYTTENATGTLNCQEMFKYQKSLTEVDMSNVQKEVSSIQKMFYYCSKLKKVNIKGLYKTSATNYNISNLFYGCSLLELADIRGLKCSGITTSSYYTSALTSVPTTAKIIVADETEKNWWKSKFSGWTNCFYTVEEAIAEGIVEE